MYFDCYFVLVDGHSKDAITQTTEELCNQAGIQVENFLSEIGGLCESLSSIVEWCSYYKDEENPKIMPLMKDCFICANEMLNFQHDQGVYQRCIHVSV